MAEDKRFYWIKLSNKFLSSRTVDFLMSQPDGANYVVLYQMLCLLTINSNGELADSIGEVIIPFDEKKIQRDTKFFSIDTVRIALTLFQKLGLIYLQENGIFRIANYEKLVGSEGSSAEKVRNWREKKRLQCNRNVTTDVTQEIRDKSIEYRDKSIDIREKNDKRDKKDKTDSQDSDSAQLSKNPFTIYLLQKGYLSQEDLIDLPNYDDFFNRCFSQNERDNKVLWKKKYERLTLAVKYLVDCANISEIENKFAYTKVAIMDSLQHLQDNITKELFEETLKILEGAATPK